MVREIRQAFRSLHRGAGTTLLAMVCLSVGIGADTTAFTTVDRLLLRPLSFPVALRQE